MPFPFRTSPTAWLAAWLVMLDTRGLAAAPAGTALPTRWGDIQEEASSRSVKLSVPSRLLRAACFLVFAVLTFSLAHAASATVYYAATNGVSSNAGTSWASPRDLASALSGATSGDQVWVMSGTYTGNFTATDGVALYGHFAGTETMVSQRQLTNAVYATTLDGNQSGTVYAIPNAATGTNTFDGFTVQNGTASGIADSSNDALVVANSLFMNNTAVNGGGILVGNTPTITNCTFKSNTASHAGGGVYLYLAEANIVNCTFTDNSSAEVGGGVETFGQYPNFTNCTFTGNQAALYGGGIDDDSAVLSVASCTFINNTASNSGGGISYYNPFTTTITDSLFTGNTAVLYGGAVNANGDLAATSCTFTDNSAGSEGGGIIVDTGRYATVAQCRFTSNSPSAVYAGETGTDTATTIVKDSLIIGTGTSASDADGLDFGTQSGSTGAYGTVANNTIIDTHIGIATGAGNGTGGAIGVANNILDGNGGGLDNTGGVVVTSSHNDIYGNVSYGYAGASPSTSDLTLDPMFVNAASDNYHLMSSSPLINAGDDSYVMTGDTDLDGNTRIIDGVVDVGCYEYGAVTTPPTVMLVNKVTTPTQKTYTIQATSADGNPLTYIWSLASTPTATLSNPTTGSTPSGATFANTITVTAPGMYNLTVTATDDLGQSTTLTFTPTFPQEPTTVMVTPATVTLAANATQAFTASVTDQFGAAIASPSIAWSVSGGGMIDANGNFTAGATPGTYTVTATATANGATATGTASVTVTMPTAAVTVTSSANPSVWYQPLTFTVTVAGAGTNPTPTGTASVTLTDPNGTMISLGTVTLGANGSGQISWAGGAQGSFTGNWTVTAAYSGDGTYAASTGTLTQVINKAQTATALAVDNANPTVGQTINLTATVTDVAPSNVSPVNDPVQFFDGTTSLGTSTTGTNGVATLAVSSLGSGTHSITAMFLGGGNRTPSTSNAVTVTVVNPGPTITSFSPTSGPIGTLVTITGTNFTGATFVTFNGTTAPFTVTSATQITANVPSGATTGVIKVRTPNGVTASAGTFTVTAGSILPSITSFSPTSGPVGTIVTITGTNFTGATFVTFNGTSAPFTVNSATQITANVPTGATTGVIKVRTANGAAASATNFTVTAGSVLPSITSFTPTSGPIGTSVVITGTNFTGATFVTFNGTIASFTVNSSTQITAIVPSGATTGVIKVRTSNGVTASATSFTVTAGSTLPSITSFTPSSGPVGTSVVLTGMNFTGATFVTFNGTIASFTVNSATQITATVPSGATTGVVKVRTPNGVTASATSFTVTH